MKLGNNQINNKQFINNILLVTVGAFVLSFGTAVFLVPFDLVTGGVSGLSIVLEKIIPLDISIDLYITILTWLMFFLGLIFLGKNFVLKTLLSTILYPPIFSLMLKLVSPDVLNGFFYLQGSEYKEIAVLLAALCGGACVGAGCAITFESGGSTGGVDVIALLLCKMFPKVKASILIFLIDASIVVAGVFALKDMVLTLLGVLSAFVCAFVIDQLFLGSSKAYVAQIVSNASDEICKGVIEKLDRTATVVNAVGAYSKQEKKMTIVSFSIREYSDLMAIINQADPDAFLTISRAHEINGEGWTADKK